MEGVPKKVFQTTPKGIEPSIKMTEPNQPLIIYQGTYFLKHKDIEIKLKGKVYFNWFPSPKAYFSGKLLKPSQIIDIAFSKPLKFELIVNGLLFGYCHIWKSHHTLNLKSADVSGELLSFAVLGDNSVAVEKVSFHLVNCYEYFGEGIRQQKEGKEWFTRNRLRLENNEYSITIDQLPEYKGLRQEVWQRGGFIITHVGELIKKDGKITFKECSQIFHCLSVYLAFLNGRWCSPIFWQGINNNKLIWQDYSQRLIDRYEVVFNWPQEYSTNGLEQVWQKFYELWQKENDKDFLQSAIHWYTECNTGFVESSIIIAQTALELVFNYYLVEKKKIIASKEAKDFPAGKKLRQLLNYLNADPDVPTNLSALRSYIQNDPDVKDAADAIVNIRNTITHSRLVKRTKLKSMPQQVKIEALDLAIWYLEISLLHILDYQGKHSNKRLKINEEIYVPWFEAST